MMWASVRGGLRVRWLEAEGPCRACRRHATGWKRRVMRQEELKDIVYQYAGKQSAKTHRMYVWGYAAVGALGMRSLLRPEDGFPPKKEVVRPMRSKFFDNIQHQVHHVACGYGNTLFACTDGSGEHCVYGTGINTDSQLGFHEFPRKSGRVLDYLIQPARLPLPLKDPDKTRVTHLASGRAHSVVVTDREGVFTLGNNSVGQCGRAVVEGETHRGSQVVNQLSFSEPIAQVVCGQDHTLLLTQTGHVYSCGLGADGQTGQGHYKASSELTRVGGDLSGEKIVFMSSKGDCILCVSDSGRVFGWGNTEYDQLASAHPDVTQVHTPTHLPLEGVGKVTQVAAAGSMCGLINADGEVYVWGYGILGKGPRLEKTPIPSRIPQTLFGQNEFNPKVKVTDLYCGMNFFAALTDQGDLLTWGRNKTGSLGLNSKKDQFFPLKVIVPAEVTSIHCGVDHVVALAQSFA